jgi:NAD dependent epimerase/dehydratase family enzyme
MTVPEFALKMMFGEMSEVLLGSQKVLPEATLKSGYEFRYTDVKLALQDAVHPAANDAVHPA